jgi:hypothetical protein
MPLNCILSQLIEVIIFTVIAFIISVQSLLTKRLSVRLSTWNSFDSQRTLSLNFMLGVV